MKQLKDVSLLFLVVIAAACGQQQSHGPTSAHTEPWAVTAWGEHYEIFAETGPLAEGRDATANVHVTRLAGFTAVTEATVRAILRVPGAPDQVFSSDAPARPGIFKIQVRAASQGEFALVFRVEAAEVSEEIPAGTVRVGTAASPGGLVASEAVSGEASGPAHQETTFLKEQQWRIAFATAPATVGSLHQAVKGTARVTSAAGGAVELTAPLDGTVSAASWPYVGLDVAAGATLLAVSPRVASERSFAEIESVEASLAAELKSATARLDRLQQLALVEAASRRQVEEAQALVTSLEARLSAARRDLETVNAVRGSGTGGERIAVRAPFAGRVAAVHVSPGQAVTAGQALARVVRIRPVWVEVSLPPAEAARLREGAAGLTLRFSADGAPLAIASSELRLVSRAPEVDPESGTIAVLLETARSADELQIGATGEAEILLQESVSGLVVPLSAIVDDGGVSVVYVQLGGETFARREVHVAVRQADLALIDGIAAGERVVVRGELRSAGRS
jgi:RND family efflux transporter MFP subunit